MCSNGHLERSRCENCGECQFLYSYKMIVSMASIFQALIPPLIFFLTGYLENNESILVGLNVRPQLMKTIKERKCRYFGHIVRGERYEYQRLLLEFTVDGKRGRGRPRTTWFSNIRDWMRIDYYCSSKRTRSLSVAVHGLQSL